MPRNLTIDGGFHFKDDVNINDFEAMTSGMLELQIKLGRQLLNQSELVNLIRQKTVIFNRLAHAYRVIYQRKVKTPQREDPDSVQTRGGSFSSVDALVIGDRDRVGTQALVELGLTTGMLKEMVENTNYLNKKLESNHFKIPEVQLLCTTDSPP